MNSTNTPEPLTRRHAIGLIGASLIPVAIPTSEEKSKELTPDEAFLAIESWDGSPLSTEEVERIFLACWPTMRLHNYNTCQLPYGSKLRQFFDREKIGRLLRLVRKGDASDRLYVALEPPLCNENYRLFCGWNCGVGLFCGVAEAFNHRMF